jgi:hypothetical protein
MPRPRFTPFGTHWIRGWVGPRAGLDAEARRKILCPCRWSNPDRPARSQTLYWLSYCGSFAFSSLSFFCHLIGTPNYLTVPMSICISPNLLLILLRDLWNCEKNDYLLLKKKITSVTTVFKNVLSQVSTLNKRETTNLLARGTLPGWGTSP